MTEAAAIQFLCAQASVRYEHMTKSEQRTFLECVMTVGAAPEAELAARTLHSLEEADASQGELFTQLQKPQLPPTTPPENPAVN